MALNVFGTPLNMTYSGTGESGNPYVIESTNHSVNTTGEIIFQTTESGTIFPNLTVDSEIASDVAGLFRNTIPIWQASGQDNFSTSFRVSANDQVKVNYIKDGSGVFGDDNVTGTVYFVPDPPEPLPEVAIVMVTQPVSSLSGSILATQPSVKIVDVNGDIVPGTLISVTVGAVAVSGTAVASGTLTVEPVSGNVVFTDLVVTGYGSYYLSFTAAGLTSASSNTITFVQDPGNPNPPIPVKPKRSYIPASVPNSGDMEINEFAINVTDKKGYVKDSNGIVHLIFGGGSTVSGVSSVIAGTGISVDTATGDVTVTNSLPDQTVSLANGTGISVTGTYPSFTVSTTITQYTDSDARKSISSSATGLTYTDTTGVFSLTSGYSIPTTTKQTQWDTAYTNRISSLTVTGSSGASTLVSNVLNIPTYTLSGLGGIGLTNLSSTATGLTYTDTTGAFSLTSGYSIPTTTKQGNWDTAYTNRITSLTTTGSGAATLVSNVLNIPTPSAATFTSLTVTGSSGASTLLSGVLNVPTYTLSGLGGIKLTDLSSTATGLTYTNTTGVFSATSGYAIPTTTKQTQWDTSYTQTQQWNGGATNLVASTGRTSLGATTVGSNILTLVNPSAVTFPRFNADNTVSALDAATFRTAIGAGTSSTTGTVTSVAMTVPTGLSVTGTPITSSGTLGLTLTAGYSIPTTTKQGNWDTAYSNYLQWDGGATNLVAATGRTSLGATTVGDSMFTLTNPSAITFPRINANNTVTALNSTDFRTAIGAGTSSTTGTVTSVAALTLGTTGTDVSSTVATGTTTPVITLNIPTASATNRGALSSADWTNFNSGFTQRLQWDGGATNLVAATGRTSLGLVIGTNVQAWDADLDAIAALAGTTGLLKKTAANTWSLDTSTYLTTNQTITLSGDVSGSGTTAITTTLATVSIAKGGTGQTTANAAVNALLPSQTGNSGKYLTTDGTNSSWGTVSSGASIPSASMQMFAGAITQTVSAGTVTTTAPTGWLLCNGNAVSRSTYSALWTALGTTSSPYGQGDGSTTFNLPDMRSRTAIGVGQGSSLSNRTLGGTVGAETVALSTAELASHNHTATDSGHIHTASAGNQLQNHQHALDRAVWTNNGSNPYTYTGGNSNIALQTPNTGNEFQVHQHAITVNNGTANVSIGNSGSGSAHNNMQPSIGLNFIIKT